MSSRRKLLTTHYIGGRAPTDLREDYQKWGGIVKASGFSADD